MKNAIILLTGVAIVLFSCKKDKDDDKTVESYHKVKSIVNPANGVSINYDYDAQGRCTRESWSNSLRKNEYVYSAGLVIKNEYNIAGVLISSGRNELNSDGLCTKTTYPADPTYERRRTFNASKQLVDDGDYENGILKYSYTSYYTGDLLDSSVNRNEAGQKTSVFKYEYYTNIAATTTLEHTGFFYFGKHTSKAVKKVSVLSYEPTTGVLISTQESNYTYETDAQGRITKTTSTGAGNGVSDYTYY